MATTPNVTNGVVAVREESSRHKLDDSLRFTNQTILCNVFFFFFLRVDASVELGSSMYTTVTNQNKVLDMEFIEKQFSV